VTPLEPLKPRPATLPEASPEFDASALPVTAVAAHPAISDAEAGDADIATAQAPRTARGRGEPHRTAAAPRTAKASPAPKAASQAADVRTGPAVSEKSAPVAASPDPRRTPSAVTPQIEAGQPPLHPPVTTGPASRGPDAWMTSPAPQPGILGPGPLDAPLEEEDFGPPPSRLSGLRNLLVSLGRRSLIEDEHDADRVDTEPRFERATVRPVYHEAPAAETDTARSASAPVRVTAPPEFLPPQSATEPEKEKEPVRPTPPMPRRERESPDEIQTLPSWRGQYRKKRYPPI
jgi:hypothetical protein